MPFIDKVKKNDVEYDIHDTTGRVSIDGESLVIPEQGSTLEPVAEFDGVKYYHKQEFDLTDLGFNESKYDVITEEKFTSTPTLPYIYSYYHGSQDVDLVLRVGGGPEQSKRLYHNGSSVAYESQAFVITKDVSEVTAEGNKIYFGSDEYEVVAYYGWLSEDGKTFISYYNVKTDFPYVVNSVKQSDSVLPIHDVRIPEAKSSDENKIVYVDAEGDFAFREEIAVSTFYMHKLQFEGLSFKVIVITDNPDAITYSTKSGSNHLKLNTTVIVNVYALVSVNGEEPKIITYAPYYGADDFGIKYLAYMTPSSTTRTQIDISTLTSDIVTII